jgi:hypothetical protein
MKEQGSIVEHKPIWQLALVAEVQLTSFFNIASARCSNFGRAHSC